MTKISLHYANHALILDHLCIIKCIVNIYKKALSRINSYLNPSRPDPEQRKEINFIKRLEAPQRSAKRKIYVNFSFNITF